MEAITFDSFDRLSRKQFADRLTKAVTTFYPFYNGAYVLSLNARFGSGKTTFLRMWQADLEARKFKVIYLNAWQNDFDDEPLVSIAERLLEEVEGKDTKSEKVKSALQGVVGAAALMGNAALAGAIGINIKEVLSEVEKDLQNNQLQKLGEQISEVSALKRNLYLKLHESLTSYLEDLTNKPLIVLVDELDRVRPDYAVKFLEAIKHIFSIQGVCFVLAVDRGQLQASVRQLYGAIDFDNYYRRFVTREASLPEAKAADMRNLMGMFQEEYFGRKERAGVTLLLTEAQKSSVPKYISSLGYSLRITPRQIEHLFRIFVQFLAVEGGRSAAGDSWIRASILLIALSVSQYSDVYHSIGAGKMSPRDFSLFVENLRFDNSTNEFTKRFILVTGCAFLLTEENHAYQEEAVDVMISVDSTQQPNRSDILGKIARISDSWGAMPSNVSGFQAIYRQLEEWKDFLTD